MNPLKEAFTKVKQDMQALQHQIDQIHQKLDNINRTLFRQTDRQQNQTNLDTSTDISTHEMPLESSYLQYQQISTGNEGVSTDRQTIRQTDKRSNYEQNLDKNQIEKNQNSQEKQQKFAQSIEKNQQNPYNKATEAIRVLETIQRNIVTQIGNVTPQEFAVLTHIYQHNLQETPVDYRRLAQEFGLSESSIRDHVKGLITKGIPIEKMKHNNKKITLKLAENLTKVASLDALLTLREQSKRLTE